MQMSRPVPPPKRTKPDRSLSDRRRGSALAPLPTLQVKWGPAPPSLPKVVKFSLLAGDPAKPGPFALRVKVPAGTVLAPHTHAQLETVTVLSGEIHHEMGEKLDKTKGHTLRSGGFVNLRNQK